MEGNLCSGMGRGCRGRFYFFGGRGARGAKKRVVWRVGLFFFQYAGCTTTWTYLMSRGVSC